MSMTKLDRQMLIEYLNEPDETHLSGASGLDYTLCGLTMDGDTKTMGAFKYVNKKLTCHQCLSIVNVCKKYLKQEQTA